MKGREWLSPALCSIYGVPDLRGHDPAAGVIVGTSVCVCEVMCRLVWYGMVYEPTPAQSIQIARTERIEQVSTNACWNLDGVSCCD